MDLGVTHHQAFVGDDIRIHYVIAGSGPPVVLLHGFPQTWYMWRKQIPVLAQHYTVIAPDLRGFGESSKPIGPYDKRSVAEDIHNLVQQLDVGPIFLVGHDMGGPTAYAYAWMYPDEVKRLVILDVALTIDEAQSLPFYKRLFHLSFHANPDIALALVAGRERTYLTHFYRNCYNPGAFTAEDIDEYIAVFSAPGAMRASMAHYGASDTDLAHRKEMVQERLLEMPVLALGGEMSFRKGVLHSCQQVATDVRGGIIPHCAHWVAEEQPELLNEQLLAFFAEER